MRELLGSSPFSLSVVASCVRLQLRLLPSTGVTRLHQYYEPLRHPSQPSLSLTSCQLIPTAITAGTSRVASDPLCLHAVANTPAGSMETCSLVLSHRLRPSPNRRRVGSCIVGFEACSAFTHVTACMLTESPMRPSTPKASAASLPPPLLRLLPGGTNQFPGGISLPLRISAFSRRTPVTRHGPFLVRVLDAVVYPNLPEWFVVGCAVLVCVAVLSVYLRRYHRRTADGQW